jgi:zinc protease
MQKIVLFIAALLTVPMLHAQNIDRSKPPKPGPAPIIKIDDPVIYKLSNGITVLVVENHKVSKVNADYFIDAGPITEGNKAGVLELMGGMLSEGTTKHSKAAFDEAVDRMGADVRLSSSGGSASALTRYFDSAFMLMTEALQQPKFTQESFDKLKQMKLTDMKADEKSAKAIAARVTNALLYGTNNPKGEYETEQTVSGLTLADVNAAYKKYITPSRGYLTFVGDIKPEQAKALAEKAFSNWKGNSLTLEQTPDAKNPAKTEIDLVDVPNAVQSEIRVTNLVTLPLSSPDYFAALLANEILGGGSTGYLFMNLREKHGFTYGAYSGIGSGRFQSAFTASASVRNAKTDSAVVEFLHEINRIRTEPVTNEQLQAAKAVYNGRFALSLEEPSLIATFARNIIINNLPKDFYRTYLQKMNAVTPTEVQRAAAKYFGYNDARVVVAGKASDVQKGLEQLDMPVKMYDAYAKAVIASAAANTKVNVDAKTIISDYIKTIGGADALSQVKTISATGSMSIQGTQLTYNQKQMAPNKQLVTVEMNGNVVSKSVFTGTTGYQQQMGNKKDMDADEIAESKMQTSIFEQEDYLKNPDIKLQVMGTEKINGTNAYKVQITLPIGKVLNEYYDENSKLLVKRESSKTALGQTLTTSSEFGDYKKTGNILLPYKMSISVATGEMNQSFDVAFSDYKINEGVSAADFE